ncbi:hypothetical protein [Protaetiibacter intestinalis]|uniref:Uncharacterized protein n=1 Tax=Protaetiibacter intestinalis TaxID=2419774 RepID=A0A387B492_9MICO|nr:hypothetical protein [Protaetiibacter intestinalis]AYF97233.1 hypothetical protein D7I47_02525 [Protaetiibacter intestinalis]
MTRPSHFEVTLTASEADERIKGFFGVDTREELDRLEVKSFPQLHVDLAVKIVDGEMGGTNLADLHAEWEALEVERRGPGGRPAAISTRTMLIILLMHALAGEPMVKRHMADTLMMRLTTPQRRQIGLPEMELDGEAWYGRLQSAHKRLLTPLDPSPMPRYRRGKKPAAHDRINRHRKLTGAKRVVLDQWHRSERPLLEERRERLNDFIFQMITNPVRHAKSIGMLDKATGDLALDATFAGLLGRVSDRADLTKDANSTNHEAGNYARKRSAGEIGPDGKPYTSTKYKFGYEFDILTMTNGSRDCPDFLIGCDMHRPAEITNVARTLLPRVAELELPTGTISVDRAYNNLLSENFHEVLLEHGYEWVFDYPGDELGSQTSIRVNGVGYIMVEGTWYLEFMPSDLINCVRRSRLPEDDPDHISKETRALQLEARRDYQLVRFGRRDDRGFQRYKLPAPDRYFAFDELTGQIKEKPTVKTVSIPLKVGLRWGQKHPYKSPEWYTAYALRSTIERKNSQLKHTTFEDIDNPYNRPARGYAANALAVAMLLTAYNIREANNHVRALEGIDTSRSPRRRAPRRRPDETLQNVAKQRDRRTLR